MPSDLPKKPQAPRPGGALDMIDALIGGAQAAKPKGKGRSVLLAHALAQRENRLNAEKRAAASRLRDAPEPRPEPTAVTRGAAAAPAQTQPQRTPAPERPGLDAMIVKALGPSARGFVHGGTLDRQGALADLIARTQDRLNENASAAPEPAPVRAAPPRAPRGDREAIIAAAMRTHREQQAVFGELSLRQRATLRATAEAMIIKAGRGK